MAPSPPPPTHAHTCAHTGPSLEQVVALLREAQELIRRSPTGHLVGEQLTYADMSFAVAVQVG